MRAGNLWFSARSMMNSKAVQTPHLIVNDKRSNYTETRHKGHAEKQTDIILQPVQIFRNSKDNIAR